MQKLAYCTLLSIFTLLPACAHEGHDKAFSNKDAMVAVNQKVHISAEGQASIGLKAEPATLEKLQSSLEITGNVQSANNKIHFVTSPVPGIVSKLTVQQNDSVTKGQVLAMVNSTEVATVLADFLDQRAIIQADITKTRAQAQNDEKLLSQSVQHFSVDVERENKLLSEGITARKMYLDALHDLDMAKSRLEGTRRQLSQNIEALMERQRTLTETTRRKLSIMGVAPAHINTAIKTGKVMAEVPIIAPAGGIILSRDVTDGESITPASKILSIVNLSPIWVSLNVNQELLSQIHVGQEVKIKCPSGAELTGKISSLAANVDPTERTVKVRVVTQNSDHSLRPEMFVTARIITGTEAQPSVVVPAQAIFEDGGKKWVYVKYGEDFQPVAVKPGLQSGGKIQVLDGLYEGDQIVVVGANQIRAHALLNSKKDGAEKPPGEGSKQPPAAPASSTPANNLLLYGVGAIVFVMGLFLAFLAGRSAANKSQVTGRE